MSTTTALAEIHEDADETTLATLPEVSGYAKLASVSFYGSMTKEPRNTKLKDAGVKPGAFYLEDDAGVIAQTPFAFFPSPRVWQYFAKVDGVGKTIQIRGKGPDGKGKDGWRPDKAKRVEDAKWDDATMALVFVPVGGDLIVPAILRTYKAVDNLWKPFRGAAQMAASKSVWAARGPLYAASAEAKLWFGRFLIVPGVTEKPLAKDPTVKFADGFSKCLPTPAPLVELFNDVADSGGFLGAVNAFDRIQEGMKKNLLKD